MIGKVLSDTVPWSIAEGTEDIKSIIVEWGVGIILLDPSFRMELFRFVKIPLRTITSKMGNSKNSLLAN